MGTTADTPGVLHVGVLGALHVTGRHGVIDIGSRQQRRVLTALVVHARHVVSTDRLVDVLWGDATPSTAVKTLRTYVYRLRRALGDEGGRQLSTRSPGYLLDAAPAHVDASLFEQLVHDARATIDAQPDAALTQLRRALAMWRGPAYAEFADEGFARADALRLEELRLAATEDLLDAKLATGRHVEVVGEAETFARRHPLRERPVEQLMLALYRSGRQSEALQTYHAFRERLGRDRGLDPSQRLQSLETDILQHEPTLTPPLADQPAGPGDDDPIPPEHAEDRLPRERTSLVGREEDAAAVVGALDDCRLVTLTGVGGVGKTRLALRAARAAAHRYPDGVWWCDLTSVTTDDAVAHAVADALAVHAPGHSVAEAVVGALGAGRLLLVVDNCEHVVDAVGPLLDLVVARCPGVAIIATSRVPLQVVGERVWRVDPLPVAHGRAEIDGGEAIALFRDRLRAVRPDADELVDADRDVIADICRRLDGLPLAIELAAARMRALNAEDLAARLDDRFRLLTRSPHATVRRHRTLEAVVDWSFQLLPAKEQVLFERLAVFVGEFTLTAAEDVCAGAGIAADEIVELIARLVDASMVATGPPDDTVRYRLLETLRAYGRERLAERGDHPRVHDRHARHYLAVAEEADARVRGADEAAAVQRLNRELAEVRAAHLWGVDQEDVDLSLRLVAALFRYALWRLRDEVFRWAEATVQLRDAETHRLFPTVCGVAGWGCGLRGERTRARGFVDAGLAPAPPGTNRVVLLEVQAHLALWEGRLDDCIACMDEAADLTNDPYNQFPWAVRGLALAYAGRSHDAVAMVDHARSTSDRLGNPTMMALARYAHGEALADHDPDRAAVLFDAAMDLADRSENLMLLGVAGVSTTSLHARHGEPTKALRSFADVLDVWSQTHDWTHLWVGLRSLVELLARIGSDRSAAMLHGAVLDAADAPPVYGADAERLTAVATELHERLGRSQLVAARVRGQTMASDDLLDWARAEIDRNLIALEGR